MPDSPDRTRRRGHGPRVLPARRSDRDVYDLACERTAIILDQFDDVYVAFSGGKDSTAVLNIALEVAHSEPRFARHLPLRAMFADEECIPQETEDYVRRVSRRDDIRMQWLCEPFQLRNACSREHPSWWTWAPEDEAKWARPMPPERTPLKGMTYWPVEDRPSLPAANHLISPPELGNSCILMGIRAQESLQRQRAVSVPGREYNYILYASDAAKRGQGSNPYHNVYKGYPIYDWRTEDVWQAAAVKGWDYNAAYDLMAMIGVSPWGQRCSPAFGEEPIGGLYQFAQCFPDVWAKTCERVPGVGAAYRYARTELYGYGSKPEKPAGLTWPEFLHHYVDLHGEAKKTVADRLASFLYSHYRKTVHPICPSAPHPLSGVSWGFLLTIAMRGDFKERKKTPTAGFGHPDLERKFWHGYAAELQSVIDAGQFPALASPRPQPADPYALIPEEYR